jgi:hypothetical protein
MRRWLVEEIDELRKPKQGEWYLNTFHRFLIFAESPWNMDGEASILKVTELPSEGEPHSTHRQV